MRSASGVNLVSAVLQTSLSRAQRRFNLSNPQSQTKRKLLKERKLEQKFQRKLKTLSKENRLLSSTKTDLAKSNQPDWTKLGFEPQQFEFEPADEQFSSFIAQLKSKYTCLNPRSAEGTRGRGNVSAVKSPKKSALLPTKKGLKVKKEKVKKLKSLFKSRQGTLQLPILEPEKERLIFEEKDDDADSGVNLDSGSPTKSTFSLLEQLRLKRLQARKERKRQKREAIIAKKVEEGPKALPEKPKMRELERNAEDTPPRSPSKSPSSKYTIEGNITLITNGRSPPPPQSDSKKVLISEVKKPVTTEVVKKGPTLPPPRYTLYDREKVIIGWNNKNYPVGCGFINLGNSCYMNAVLQALFHTPAFVNWLVNEEVHQSKCRANTQTIHQCLVCAMHLTLKESMRNQHVMRPVHIHNKLKIICKTFSHGRQEDAHEFLRYLLEAMEKGYLIALGAMRLDSRSKETTPLGQIFGGYIRTEVTCHKCSYISTTFQPLAELQLDIRHFTTVEDSISNHFRKERLEGNDYKCERCLSVSQATKQFTIEQAPIVLCLQLKRFTLFGGKINKPVHCNRHLDLTRFQHSSIRINGSQLKYRLVGLVTHIGSSPNCGHYTAIAEASNKSFFQFDDTCVRQVSAQVALNTDAYVVIYELEKNGERTTSAASSPVLSKITKPMTNGYPKPATVTSATLKASLENRDGAPVRSITPKPVLNPLLSPGKSEDRNGLMTPTKPRSLNPFVKPSPTKPQGSKLVLTQASLATRPSSLDTSSGSRLTNGNGLPSLTPKSNEREKVSFSLKSPGMSPANKLLLNPQSSATLPSSSQYLTPSARTKLETRFVKSPLSKPHAPSPGQKPIGPTNGDARKEHNGTGTKLFSVFDSPKRKSPSPPPKRLNGSSGPSKKLVPYDDEEEEDRGYGTPGSKGPETDSSREARSPSVTTKLAGLFTRTPVKTWEGTDSTLTQVVESDRKRVFEKSKDDLYDEEVDAGKTKKARKDEVSAERNQNQSSAHSSSKAFDLKQEEKVRAVENERRHSLDTPPSHQGPKYSGSVHGRPQNGSSSHGTNYVEKKGYSGPNGNNFRRYNSSPNFSPASSAYPQHHHHHTNGYNGGQKHRATNYRGSGSWKHNSDYRRFSRGNGAHYYKKF